MRAWRWPARLVVLAIVVVGVIVDNRVSPPEIEVIELSRPGEPQLLRAADALTSTWFCPVVQLSEDEVGAAVTATLRVVNTRAESVSVTTTFISSTSAPLVVSVRVAAGAVIDIDTENFVDADRVAAIVEAPGGGIAVSRSLRSSLGDDIAPCAPSAGVEWTIVAGDTQRDSINRLVIFNPFPEDANIDVQFATEVEAGAVQAADLRTIVVPGNDVVSVDIGDAVRRRDQVSTHLTVRAGRVVVDRVQVFGGSEGRVGLAVALGSVDPSTRWYQPGVIVDAGTVAYVHIHNPNDTAAEIDIAAQSGVVFATGDPIGLTVPARDTIVVPVVATGSRDEGLRPRG